MSLTIIFYPVLLFISTTAASRTEKPSACEELQRYDFPMGILPKGLNYEPVIKGVSSKGKLRKLSGVSVKVLLVWVDIVEVRRRGDNLEFSVGLASANFPIENFEECPQCGCGLDCVLMKVTILCLLSRLGNKKKTVLNLAFVLFL
ncbi:hypothetical protein RND71_024632 [Anisodus tanguticus]|uniref:Uncharacterized protein n=1 Tax=Anisodus tanguticus TaxID=243964 RepID=A0AAE1V9N7_9SOLA|nr:hypothetical protein RND71_024632 [Anisodus tanguticus]